MLTTYYNLMQQNNQQAVDPDFQKDYEFIRADIKKVVINNIIFVALLVALYFANQKFGFLVKLENLF